LAGFIATRAVTPAACCQPKDEVEAPHKTLDQSCFWGGLVGRAVWNQGLFKTTQRIEKATSIQFYFIGITSLWLCTRETLVLIKWLEWGIYYIILIEILLHAQVLGMPYRSL
jgi:hypothetical protein